MDLKPTHPITRGNYSHDIVNEEVSMDLRPSGLEPAYALKLYNKYDRFWHFRSSKPVMESLRVSIQERTRVFLVIPDPLLFYISDESEILKEGNVFS